MRMPWYLLSIALVLATGLPSLAQTQTKPRYNASEVQGRIERSARLQQEALENLNDPGRVEGLVRQAFRELSTAQSAMVINASGQKFPDPLLDVNNQKAKEALQLMQRAEDLITVNRKEPGPHMDEVRRSLERSIRLTRLVLAL
jgi:apolipoprotein N-acyltransferase